MPGFKDFMKKAKEIAEKGVNLAREAVAMERLVKDFDEVTGNLIVEILSENGYRPMGQSERGDYFKARLSIEDESKVKHIIEKDILRHYKPKDREKIINKIPDYVEVAVYRRERGGQPVFLGVRFGSEEEDMAVSLKLRYIVEREGGFFSRVKRDEREVSLGGFTFSSADFIDPEKVAIKRDELRSYLESKLRGLGVI